MMEVQRTHIVREAEDLRAAYIRELVGNFFRALHLRRTQPAGTHS